MASKYDKYRTTTTRTQPTTTSKYAKYRQGNAGIFDKYKQSESKYAKYKQSSTREYTPTTNKYAGTSFRTTPKEEEKNEIVREYEKLGITLNPDDIKGYDEYGVPLGGSGKRLLYYEPGAVESFKNIGKNIRSFFSPAKMPVPGDPEYETYTRSVAARTGKKHAAGLGFVSGITPGFDLGRVQEKAAEAVGLKGPEYSSVAIAKQERPGAYTAGNVAGSLAKYGALYSAAGPGIEKAVSPLTGKIASPFLKTMAVEGAKDIAIGGPLGVLDALGEGKKGLAGEAAKNLGYDVLANAAFFGIGKAAKAAKPLLTGKKGTADAIQEATGAAAKTMKETPTGTLPEGMVERGFSRNVRTDAYTQIDIKKSFDIDPLGYEQLSNKVTQSKAEKIFNRGFNEALEDWHKNINNFRPEDIPLARMLANQAANDGNMGAARKIIADTAEKLTKAGQYSQAARILRQSDPITALTYIEKELDKLNREGRNIYKSKWKDFSLTDNELNALRNSDSAVRDKALQELGDRISQNMPSTGIEKFNTWRRMAMLLNPKTHMRNTIGNVIMMGMRKTGDVTGAVLEKMAGLKPGQRTKAFLWSKNKDLVKKVDTVWDSVKDDLLKRSRWELENLKFAGKDKRIFKSGVLDFLDRLSKTTLNAEDVPFVQRAYKDALGQYMSANKLTKATKEALDYAKRRAYEATFKQANLLSNFISQAKRKKGIGTLVEAAIPFSQTPTNIAARAVEYSPVGLFKSLYSKIAGKTAADVIEDLSKGLTGTAIAGLGFYLSSMGWMRTKRSTSRNVEAILTQAGQQPMSINTPLGNMTFDWAQPFAIPFAMGGAVYESLNKAEDVDMIEAIKDALAAGGDTIFDMSMMQNVKDLFGGGYGSPTEAIMDLPISYIEQAFPSVFGQIARTVDPIRRTTYDPDELKGMGRKFASRTPGASRTLEPNLDIWGNEQEQGGALQQFINPAYVKEITQDKVTKEIVRLYKSTKETSFLPKVAPKSFTVNGVKVKLTPKEITEFQKSMGKLNYKMIKSLMSTASYRMFNDKAKMKRIEKIVEDNYDKVKEVIYKKHKRG